jgi:hypothetical protein
MPLNKYCGAISCIRQIRDKKNAPKSAWSIERTCAFKQEGCPITRPRHHKTIVKAKFNTSLSSLK